MSETDRACMVALLERPPEEWELYRPVQLRPSSLLNIDAATYDLWRESAVLPQPNFSLVEWLRRQL